MTQETTVAQSKSAGRYPLFDIAAVLCLAVFPSIFDSAIIFFTAPTEAYSTSFVTMLYQLIVRSVQVAIPMLLIIQLRNSRWQEHGFLPLRPLHDLSTAFGLMLASYFAYYIACCVLMTANYDLAGDAEQMSELFESPKINGSIVFLILLASLTNGFTEELVMRSYLIPRFEEVTGSKLFALLVTTILFACYHLYQGLLGVIAAMCMGLIVGWYFQRYRRFWPLAIAHVMMDVIPLIAYARAGSSG